MIDEEYTPIIEWNEEDTLSLEQVKRRVTNLRKIVDEGLLEDFTEDEWKLLMRDGLYSMVYHPKRSWNETVKVMEYFKSLGAPIEDGAWVVADQMADTVEEHFTPERKRQCNFLYRKMEWILENGANVNGQENSRRILDFFAYSDDDGLDDLFSEQDAAYVKKICNKTMELLKKHGA